jgi:hypothetical protein
MVLPPLRLKTCAGLLFVTVGLSYVQAKRGESSANGVPGAPTLTKLPVGCFTPGADPSTIDEDEIYSRIGQS